MGSGTRMCIRHRQPGLTAVSGVSLSYGRAMLSRITEPAVDLATGRPLMYNIRETLSV